MCQVHLRNWIFLRKIYLFIFRESRRKEERKRNINVWLPLAHTPNWGPGQKPRRVLWLGIKPGTLWFAGWCSIHWATLARAGTEFLIYLILKSHVVNGYYTEQCEYRGINQNNYSQYTYWLRTLIESPPQTQSYHYSIGRKQGPRKI